MIDCRSLDFMDMGLFCASIKNAQLIIACFTLRIIGYSVKASKYIIQAAWARTTSGRRSYNKLVASQDCIGECNWLTV